MDGTFLVLNSGSSTHKLDAYELPQGDLPLTPPVPLWQARIEGPTYRVKTQNGKSIQGNFSTTAPENALTEMLSTLLNTSVSMPKGVLGLKAVGHRVVHGGSHYQEPTRITEQVKADIQKYGYLAPEHNFAALAGIDAVEKTLGSIEQWAVFDTAFHQSIPQAAAAYPVPYAWTKRSIKRYGFHGISHAYATECAAKLLGVHVASLHLITCHLGNGCSLTAVREGKSVDTTMGFTPLEGLMMGTRSGTVDPGLLLYLLTQEGYRAEELTYILGHESGLKGVSGISGDVRDVIRSATDGHAQSRLAMDMYVHRIRYYLGAMLASLDRLDAVVFTGGVGENSAWIREQVCQGFGFLGLELDAQKNTASPKDADIASKHAKVRVLVVQAQENWAIVRSCWSRMKAEG